MNIEFASGYRVPPYFLKNAQTIKHITDTNISKSSILNMPCQCEVSLRPDGEKDWWVLPIEPVVNITGKNIIIKRNILKMGINDTLRRGSVKELWSQDDYQVTIAGVLKNDDDEDLPQEDWLRLKNICEKRAVVEVQSKIFTIFNITKIAIEDYEFPFTKGMNNQMYTIKAVSDDFDINQLMIEK